MFSHPPPSLLRNLSLFASFLSMVELLHVMSEPHLSQAKSLFLEYATSLSFNLCFQGFEEEVSGLPGLYCPPGGCLLLALRDGSPCGCGAFRPLGDGICEMKRLYVRPNSRGLRVGRMLAEALIAEATARGYHRMNLDTIDTMVEAIGLYRSLGFQETEPYTSNPVPGAKFFSLSLAESG